MYGDAAQSEGENAADAGEEGQYGDPVGQEMDTPSEEAPADEAPADDAAADDTAGSDDYSGG